MNTDTAIGWLVVGLLNEHFPHPESTPEELKAWELDEPMGGPFCAINCGPCKALKWLADNDREGVERLIIRTGYADMSWAWWTDSGLRWAWLEHLFASHKACAMSAGQLIPCDWEPEDEQ